MMPTTRSTYNKEITRGESISQQHRYKLDVFVDGAVIGNGMAWAKSSCAVYCPQTGFCESFGGGYDRKHSNNTAELMGIYMALRYVWKLNFEKRNVKEIEILSDSQYALNSVDKWNPKKNWSNYQQIVEIRQYIQTLREEGMVIKFTWVKGHDGNIGNEIVNYLAEQKLK
jgi:ribonuclease HI